MWTASFPLWKSYFHHSEVGAHPLFFRFEVPGGFCIWQMLSLGPGHPIFGSSLGVRVRVSSFPSQTEAEPTFK